MTRDEAVEILKTCDNAEEFVADQCNCYEVEIDSEWDIWIQYPQDGHWLDDEAIIELAKAARRDGSANVKQKPRINPNH